MNTITIDNNTYNSIPVGHDLLTSAIYRFMIEELRFHKPLWFIL